MPPARPSAAYPENLEIMDLDTTETFVVATARLWAAPHRDPWQVHPDWRDGFRAAGITADGAHAFDALFWIVVAGGLRSLDIRCPRCPRLGADEGLLLRLVAHAQAGRPAQVEATLGAWLPPCAGRAAAVHASIYARALMAAGLLLPVEHRRPAPARARSAPHPGASLTLH